MADKLENFILDNRNAFDDKDPSEKIWNNLEKKLRPQSYNNYLWKAAAVIFFISTVLLSYQNYLQEPSDNQELAELESFYFNQIDYKQSLINDYSWDGSPDFEQDMQKLDAMYKVLKEEWQKKPSKEVMEALTLNLIIRIDLLNRQLHKLDSEQEPSAKEKRI